MNRLLTLAAVAGALLAASAQAADGYLYGEHAGRHTTLVGVAWEYALPTWDLRSKLVEENSPQGAALTFRRGVLPRVSAGVDIGWNRFRHAFPNGGAAEFQDYAARLTGHLYLSTSRLQPYLGLGVGGVWREVAVVSARTSGGLGFTVDPQLGLLYTVRPGVALHLAARYAFTTASLDVVGDKRWRVENPQWVGLQAGLAFY